MTRVIAIMLRMDVDPGALAHRAAQVRANSRYLCQRARAAVAAAVAARQQASKPASQQASKPASQQASKPASQQASQNETSSSPDGEGSQDDPGGLVPARDG